jgi:macrolide-specific efflux system membrane fusion protein
LDEARSELPAALEKKRLDVEQARIVQARGDERLAKLRADRNLLTVTAPHDGIVFYGAPNRGKWSGAASVAPQLRPFATLTANATVITVVEPRPLFVRVDLPEKDLHLVRAGITGQALPTAFLDLKIPAKVTSVSAVPVSGGSFDLQIAVELAESAAAVMPGMTCQVKLTSYSSEAALTVPAASVFTDEADGRRFVYFVPADGTHEKRYVKVGRSNDAVIEIVEGLKAGERILQSEPAAK